MKRIKEFIIGNMDSIIKPTVVLFAICIVISLALSLSNLITAPKIAVLEQKTISETMEKVIPADKYTESDMKLDGEKITYYTAEKNGKAEGYIFTFAEKGYGGDVKVMTAVGVDGSIIAVNILDASNETPGLGQNVTKEGFYSQFKGADKRLTVVKSGAKDNEIDAVTGATISSRAVTAAVNRALSAFEEIKGGAAE